MRVTISTVIPTLNRPDGLLEAVSSVLEQSRLPDELVIIDQSQDDRSSRAVHDLFLSCGPQPKLIYIHDTNVKGLVEAKERGVQESSVDIISFIEDDVVLMPNYFEMMEKGFKQKPDMLGCSGVLLHIPTYTKIYRILFHIFHRGIFYDPRIDVHKNGKEHGVEEDKIIMSQSTYLSGGISAYRRGVFDKVKFDTMNGFFMYEDIEFSTRASLYFGKENFFINHAMKLDHRMSPINRIRLESRWKRKLCE